MFDKIDALRLKTGTKDLFQTVVSPHVSKYVMPLLPGKSPFNDCMTQTGLLFVHVPKTAGTSIKETLYKTTKKLGHRSIDDFYAYNPELAQQLFKFAVVRNPWDRCLSAYSFLRKAKKTSLLAREFDQKVLAQTDGFTDFVQRLQNTKFRRSVLSYVHFRPQHYWVCRRGQKAHAMDRLGRFETLSADVEAVFTELGQAQTPLSNRRVTKTVGYREVYTPETKEIIARIYAQDIALFDYEF